jgi:hypothetical protein
MSISPWNQFDTEPPWKFALLLDSKPLPLTGLTLSNFQFIMHPTNGSQEIVGTGTFSDLLTSDPTFPGTPPPPSIIYHESRLDVSVIGQYRVWIVVTFTDGEQETLFLGYVTIQGR